MLSSLQQHILYPSYCPMHELNVAFSEMAPGRFPTAGYAYIGFMSFRGWRYNHYHTLPHEWKCLCTVYIYTYNIYILKHPSHAFHLFFSCVFTTPPWRQRPLSLPSRVAARLGWANSLLQKKRLLAPRTTWNVKTSSHIFSFHIIPSRCISSSIVSCYFHHVSSSFWCHLMPLRTPLRTPFYVSSCVVSVRHWFVGCLNVAVPLPGADGLPVRAGTSQIL